MKVLTNETKELKCLSQKERMFDDSRRRPSVPCEGGIVESRPNQKVKESL